MSHITSKEQCQANIKGVCGRCGGPLSPIETVDNAGRPTFWSGCEKCWRFDNGVTEDVFKIAKAMVEQQSFNPYSFSTPIPDRIAGTCHIVENVLWLKDNIKFI